MTDFNAAERRATALARRMLRDGFEPHLITDSLITTGLSVWAAATGNTAAAEILTRAWARIRDAA